MTSTPLSKVMFSTGHGVVGKRAKIAASVVSFQWLSAVIPTEEGAAGAVCA